jgi:hypothetical protein
MTHTEGVPATAVEDRQVTEERVGSTATGLTDTVWGLVPPRRERPCISSNSSVMGVVDDVWGTVKLARNWPVVVPADTVDA